MGVISPPRPDPNMPGAAVIQTGGLTLFYPKLNQSYFTSYVEREREREREIERSQY